MMRRPWPGRSFSLLLGAASGLLAACTEPPPLCRERARRCLSIESRDVMFRGSRRFEIQLANTCHEEIEFKLCFEVRDGTADCRQDTLAPTRRTVQRIALNRFAGRTRIFVRYLSEAKACRFPLTRDIKF